MRWYRKMRYRAKRVWLWCVKNLTSLKLIKAWLVRIDIDPEKLAVLLIPWRHSNIVEPSFQSVPDMRVPDPLREFYDNLWKWKAKSKEKKITYRTHFTEEEVRYNKWDEEFIGGLTTAHWLSGGLGIGKILKLMFNRMVMGTIRYGLNSFFKQDYVKAMRAKIDMYQESGNIEFLVDVANIAMLEFKFSKHKLKHFSGGDVDDRFHPKEK
jgi:hypothetical protein